MNLQNIPVLGGATNDSGASEVELDIELQIGDPNNQPYITAVGGTSFQGPDGVTTFDPGKNLHPTYPGSSLELPWTDGCDPQTCAGGATGGGVSRIWAEPDYAADPNTGQYFPGVVGTYSQMGAYCGQQPGVLCRENPDISLDADPSTGFSIYCTDPGDAFCSVGEFTKKPGWIRLGGTSCAAPVWAGIAALDIHKHSARLGLFNYIVYPFDSSSGYASQFHDIISSFTNGSGGNINGQNVPPAMQQTRIMTLRPVSVPPTSSISSTRKPKGELIQKTCCCAASQRSNTQNALLFQGRATLSLLGTVLLPPREKKLANCRRQPHSGNNEL